MKIPGGNISSVITGLLEITRYAPSLQHDIQVITSIRSIISLKTCPPETIVIIFKNESFNNAMQSWTEATFSLDSLQQQSSSSSSSSGPTILDSLETLDRHIALMQLLRTLQSRSDVLEALASTSPVRLLLRLARQVAPPAPADSDTASSSTAEEQKEGEQKTKEEEKKEEHTPEMRMEEGLTTLRQLATDALKHPMPKK